MVFPARICFFDHAVSREAVPVDLRFMLRHPGRALRIDDMIPGKQVIRGQILMPVYSNELHKNVRELHLFYFVAV
jgi:hypothetical protein